ncbi:plastocyanin [Thermosporothrix hazakensis]|jgi:plastocyanin|uniref:Plastocyanin n=2 Tax=Thermosporothrix TaxID=768650 RepID=A0A326UCH5_THEHA|nr:plastocyanin/azurin family copper-binding protein [Thermosporothrix hazakensis]PZW31979.1 plastocyanin [Thermosporothrix hazakensis]BBH91549.1 hypothetical protein KTC_63000 [Thermosporothrix sp. COM3]GCE49695.1 hypothetical protein KTH_45640 [Thermosporothrix hazakensis]
MRIRFILAPALLGFLILTLLVACGSTSTTTSTEKQQSASDNEVHMTTNDFVQKSITIHKGESITLIADNAVPHYISNGTWNNGSAKPKAEAGAPTANNITINGNSTGKLGPFNTSGTFQFYCTIHPGMNLTVIVQ